MDNVTKTHADRIATLEALVIALADDMLATAQRTRVIAGHTLTLDQYLAALRERGERATK
jgi:hypothetical protein